MGVPNKQRHWAKVFQPRGFAALHRGHWATEGLVSAIIPQAGGPHRDHVDIASGLQLAHSSNAMHGARGMRYGLGRHFDIGNQNYLSANSLPLNIAPFVTGWTMYCWVMPIASAPAAQRAWWAFGKNVASNSPLIRYQQNNSTGVANAFIRNDALTTANFSHTTQLLADRSYAICGWSNGVNSHGIRVMAQDSDVTVTDTTSFASTTATFDRYAVGVDLRQSATNPGDQVQIGPLIYNRVHDFNMQSEILRNPYIIFAPQHRVVKRPALSGAFNLVPATLAVGGFVTVSGQISDTTPYWSIPTNIAPGTTVQVIVFGGSIGAGLWILTQGSAVVGAGGTVRMVAATGSVGDKTFAFVHNYDDNTATTSMYGSPAIATRTVA